MAKGRVIELANESICNGCGACLNVCPTGSISMAAVEDSLHFYPSINTDTCVECGKCERICPALHNTHQDVKSFAPQYYCAWNKSAEQRRMCTSGGVGAAIVSEALKKGYYVAGVRFDERWHAEHIVTNDAAIADQFRGSKYLQSDTSSVYKRIKDLIKRRERVLFIGTPCQVDAVKAVVPNSEGSLLTCGIICHGVNAPVVWSDFVNYLQNKKKGELKQYNFRSKIKGWGTLFIDYEMSGGKRYAEPAWRNMFHIWFGKHYMMRESCFHCTYRKKERYSDLVIGDFWGVEKVLPKLATKDGVSALICVTEYGQQFIKNSEMLEMIPVEAKQAVSVLKGFLAKNDNEDIVTKQIGDMHRFAVQYHSRSFSEMVELYPCPTRLDMIKASIKYHLGLNK